MQKTYTEKKDNIIEVITNNPSISEASKKMLIRGIDEYFKELSLFAQYTTDGFLFGKHTEEARLTPEEKRSLYNYTKELISLFDELSEECGLDSFSDNMEMSFDNMYHLSHLCGNELLDTAIEIAKSNPR